MTQVTEEHGLYQAAVGFMVASKSDADSWEHVASWVHNMRGTTTHDGMKAESGVVEKQIKKDFGITTMPSAWRSAKATALKAVVTGVSLKENDQVVGKTEIAKRNKLAEKASQPVAQIRTMSVEIEGDLVNLYRKRDSNRFKTPNLVSNLRHFLHQVEAHA